MDLIIGKVTSVCLKPVWEEAILWKSQTELKTIEKFLVKYSIAIQYHSDSGWFISLNGQKYVLDNGWVFVTKHQELNIISEDEFKQNYILEEELKDR